MQDHQLRNIDIFIESDIVKGAHKSIEDKYLNIRFCHGDEVNEKRLKFVRFKQGFYQRQDHLKKNGQKFHTVQLIEKYINDNIDELFKNRKRDADDIRRMSTMRSNVASSGRGLKRKGTMSVVDLEMLPPHKLTGYQKLKIHKEKRKYADFLLAEAEKAIDTRRLKMRVNLVEEIYQESGLKIGFTQKNTYLENRIESTQKYFDFMNDLNNKGAEMMQIRKDLFKVNKEIENNKANNIGLPKVDPFEILTVMGGQDQLDFEKI